MSRLLTWLETIGYDRRSIVAASVMGAVCLGVAINWRHLIVWSFEIDWLLTGIWAFMGALLVWQVRPKADLKLLFVGLMGGFLIEWWGTETLLWNYFTKERPPLWILPAWPVAALTIDRLNRLTQRAAPWLTERLWPLYWVALPGFVLVMTRFLWPTIHIFASQVVVALMIFVAVWRARPGPDLSLFITGSALGIFLEYWGTSRHCWTYYTQEIPPYEAIIAHGFASVAFARGLQALDLVLGALPFGAALATEQPVPRAGDLPGGDERLQG